MSKTYIGTPRLELRWVVRPMPPVGGIRQPQRMTLQYRSLYKNGATDWEAVPTVCENLDFSGFFNESEPGRENQ